MRNWGNRGDLVGRARASLGLVVCNVLCKLGESYCKASKLARGQSGYPYQGQDRGDDVTTGQEIDRVYSNDILQTDRHLAMSMFKRDSHGHT
jgi:hypothetical protein